MARNLGEDEKNLRVFLEKLNELGVSVGEQEDIRHKLGLESETTRETVVRDNERQ